MSEEEGPIFPLVIGHSRSDFVVGVHRGVEVVALEAGEARVGGEWLAVRGMKADVGDGSRVSVVLRPRQGMPRYVVSMKLRARVRFRHLDHRHPGPAADVSDLGTGLELRHDAVQLWQRK